MANFGGKLSKNLHSHFSPQYSLHFRQFEKQEQTKWRGDCGNENELTFFDINGLCKLDEEPFQLYTCHSVASNMTVTERFATFRYCSLTRVYVRLGFGLRNKLLRIAVVVFYMCVGFTRVLLPVVANTKRVKNTG